MKRWTAWVGATLLIVLLSMGTMLAQDAPMGDPVPVSIGDITGGATPYYGQHVTFQGTIREFVSTNAFVLTDGTMNVLVVNNSGHPLPNSFVKGHEVSIAGRVHPSFTEVVGDPNLRLPSFYEERLGMMGSTDTSGTGTDSTMATPVDPAIATPVDSTMATPVDPAIATPATGTGTSSDTAGNTTDNLSGTMRPYEEDLLGWVYAEALPDEFDVYTVIELTDPNTLSFAPVQG